MDCTAVGPRATHRYPKCLGSFSGSWYAKPTTAGNSSKKRLLNLHRHITSVNLKTWAVTLYNGAAEILLQDVQFLETVLHLWQPVTVTISKVWSTSARLIAGTWRPEWVLLHHSITLQLFFIAECVYRTFLCTMWVFEVRASSSYPRLPLCEILFRLWPSLLS